MSVRVLVAEDDPVFGAELVRRLSAERADLAITLATDVEAALAAARREHPRLAVLDLALPRKPGERPRQAEGERLIETLARELPYLRRVVLSAQDRDDAVRLLLGHRVEDYLFKDSRWDEIVLRLSRHLEAVAPQEEEVPADDAIVGESDAIRRVIAWVDRAAPEDTTVHVTGETGTGKELVARRLHARSRRAGGPFVAVHCGAIPETLVESELFGHVAGAFSGATGTRKGRFASAHGGTLFLDEIGEVPPAVQAKLLRVLETRAVEPLGADRATPVDVRLVTATHRDLEAEVAAGRFREDLLHRLAVFPVRLPSLRERREDLPLLVKTLLARLGARMARRATGLTPEAMARLAQHPFKGNIRELRNMLEGAALRADGPVIGETDLALPGVAPAAAAGSPADPGALFTEGFQLESYIEGLEKKLLEEALRRAGGNGAEAGRLLGLKEHTFRARARRYGVW